MGFQAKLNKKYKSVLHCISSFEGTSYKKKKQDKAASSFISCFFTSAFTSVDIILCVLEFHATLSEIVKKIFVTNFPLFNGLTQPPTP